MSKLNDLIKELCPNGVEHKKLGDVCTVATGDQLNKSLLTDNGEYPVYNGGMAPSGYWNDYNAESDTIIISQGGASAGYVNFVATNFWAGAHCYIVKPSSLIENKYLYYLLKNMQAVIQGSKIGAGIPGLNRQEILKLEVPLPPLKIQQEIVKILDKFTQLQAELQAELDLRLKQYEYYRDELLSFDKLNNLAGVVRRARLGEVAKYSVARISADLVDDSTYVGVDNLLPDKRGKINSSHVPTAGYLTKFVAGDVLIGNIRPYLRKIWLADIDGGTNGDVLSIHVVDKLLNSRFLYYVLSSERFFTYSVNNSKGAKMPRGDRRSIMEYEFTIPSLNAQQKIVEVLDRFSSITTSLTNGLPAEIKLRQQQYEYYRDELLSFKLTNV